MIKADALQVDESALTGETYPRHKHADPAPAEAALAERHSALFQGSHVVSGQGEASRSPPDPTPSWDRCPRH